MFSKIAYMRQVFQTFSHISVGAKVYLFIRILLLPGSFLKELDRHLPLTANVLDVGCGYGLISLFLSYRGHIGKIQGVDIDAQRIHDLQTLSLPGDVTFAERDLIREGFDGLEGYDTAVLVDILHHLDEPTQVKLIEFLAKHCSYVILKDIDTTPRYKYYWNYFHDRYVMKNEILCFLGSDRIKQEFEKHGFSIEFREVWSIFPYPHYMFLASKNKTLE